MDSRVAESSSMRSDSSASPDMDEATLVDVIVSPRPSDGGSREPPRRSESIALESLSLNEPSNHRKRHTKLGAQPASGALPPRNSQYQRRYPINELADWKWEFAACFSAFLSVLAMFLTLYIHEGEAFPQWPLSISINTVLSVYVVIFETSILFSVAQCIGQLQWSWFLERPRPLIDLQRFNDATRGFWGSLNLIRTQRLSQPLSIVGTLITIAMTIGGPFIQELVQTADCHISIKDQAEAALLPRTNFFRRSQLQGGLEAALSDGIFSTQQRIEGQCATGNCTFDDVFSTVGFCSTCEDITSHIQTEETFFDCRSKLIDNPSYHCNPNFAAEIRSWLPSGLSLTNRWNDFYSENGSEIFVADVWRDTSTDTSTAHHVQFLTGNSTMPNRLGHPFVAADCTIDLCIRYYKAKFESGRLTETFLERSDAPWALLEFLFFETPAYIHRPGYLSLLDLQCVPSDQEDFLREQGYNLAETGRWLPFGLPEIQSLDRDGRPSRYPDNKVFGKNIKSFLERGCLHIIVSELLRGQLERYLRNRLSGYVGNHVASGLTGSESLQAVYNLGRVDFNQISDKFTKIADSLTWHIRSSGITEYSQPAVGQTLHFATCLEVRWGWIAVPVSLATLTLGLLLYVVVHTVSHELPTWKCSPLAWHLRGPFGTPHSQATAFKTGEEQPRTIKEMEDLSGKIMVILRDKKDPHIELVGGSDDRPENNCLDDDGVSAVDNMP